MSHFAVNTLILQVGLTAVLALGSAVLKNDAWSAAQQKEPLTIEIVYLEQEVERPPVLSNLVSWPEDEGEQGADLGAADNNTTGKFLQQKYQLNKVIVGVGGDILGKAAEALDGGPKLAVLNVSSEILQAISALPEAQDDLLFNTASPDTELRRSVCLTNVLHTLPSRAMLADALMQLLVKKRWTSLFLVSGQRPGDIAFATALRNSAKKFGLDIDFDKDWVEDADLRRNAAAEVPAFTQGKDYDVVLVADEAQDFGQYVMYNTWLPRPVAGNAGMQPLAWHRVVEQWGAAQLQSRFTEQAGRSMNSLDYAAWAAVRSIGEAVTRTKSTDPATLREFIYSDAFSLAAFKGAKLTYRNWNGQLRQPIPLIHPRAVVALAPLEGFIHQHTELDTLGLDQPESECQHASEPR